jgi:Putative restriction endonuclease
MATALTPPLTISEEEYLTTSYSPDCDFVDGVVLDRPLGQFDHANLQRVLVGLFFVHEQEWGVLGLPEQRLRVRPRKYRVPDLLVLTLDYDRAQVVTIPPLLCIEIVSPDDRLPLFWSAAGNTTKWASRRLGSLILRRNALSSPKITPSRKSPLICSAVARSRFPAATCLPVFNASIICTYPLHLVASDA